MKAPRAIAAPIGRLKRTSRRTKKIPAAIRPRTTELRQVGGASPRAAAGTARASLGFRLLATAWAGAAFGIDPAALGAAVLATALLLGLGHRLKSKVEAALDRVQVRVEAANRHVLRVAGERRRRDQPDQLRLDAVGRRAAPASSRTRSTTRPSGIASGSWTLVETWARPLPSSSPIARTPGGPPPASRSPAATARAISRSPPVELDVEGGEGRAGGDQGGAGGRVGRGRPAVRSQLPRLHPQRRLVRPPLRKKARSRRSGSRRGRRRGRPERRARRSGRRRRARPRRRALPSPGSSQTSGQTSSAPTAGCRPT